MANLHAIKVCKQNLHYKPSHMTTKHLNKENVMIYGIHACAMMDSTTLLTVQAANTKLGVYVHTYMCVPLPLRTPCAATVPVEVHCRA